MPRKIIISCALTGGAPLARNAQHVPVTPAQIADDAVAAARAGAAIVHIHVRDPATGAPSMAPELYAETVERIRARDSAVLINLTTGAGARYAPDIDDPATSTTIVKSPAERTRHVEHLRPEICTLDIATMNFGLANAVVNTPDHLRVMSRSIQAAGVKPELEVFDVGHVRLAQTMIDAGDLPSPPFFQFCLGIMGGAPATVEALLLMRSLLPAGVPWSAFGIGRAQMPMVAQSALLGGHVRVGLEDNLYLRAGELAKGNEPLVARAVQIIQALDDEVASPAEAREILSLPAATARHAA